MSEVIKIRVRLSRKFIELLSTVFKYVQKKDYDYIIVVAGDEGVGKSTLALHITAYLNYLRGLGTIVDMSFVYFDKWEIDRFLDQLDEELSVHLFDEAHNIIPSSDATTVVNKSLASFFKTARALKQFYIFVTPTFFELDTNILRRADILIYVKERGVAEVYFDKRKAHLLAGAWEMKKKYSKLVSIEMLKLYYKLKPNMIIRFGEIDGDAYSIYYKVKRQRILEHVQLVKEQITKKLAGTVETVEKVSLNEFMKRFKLTPTQLIDVLDELDENGKVVVSGNSRRSIIIDDETLAIVRKYLR